MKIKRVTEKKNVEYPNFKSFRTEVGTAVIAGMGLVLTTGCDKAVIIGKMPIVKPIEQKTMGKPLKPKPPKKNDKIRYDDITTFPTMLGEMPSPKYLQKGVERNDYDIKIPPAFVGQMPSPKPPQK